jgi:hypothetical protein
MPPAAAVHFVAEDNKVHCDSKKHCDGLSVISDSMCFCTQPSQVRHLSCYEPHVQGSFPHFGQGALELSISSPPRRIACGVNNR